MEIASFISELLYNHECVIVPRLGGFLARYQGAVIHPVQHKFMPPSRKVAFNPALLENDGLLINYISRRKTISYDDAAQWVQSQVDQILTLMPQKDGVLMPALGKFVANTEGRLQFNPDESANFLHESYGLASFVSPAIRRESLRQAEKRVIIEDRRAEKAFVGSWHSILWPAVAAVFVIAILSWTIYSQFFRTNQYVSESNLMPVVSNNQAAISPALTAIENSDEIKKAGADPIQSEELLSNEKAASLSDEILHEKTTNEIPGEDILIIEEESPVDQENTDLVVAAGPIRNYYIICGSYLNRAKANRFYQSLLSKGYDARLLGPYAGGRIRVSSGLYHDQELASQRLDEIRKIIRKDAWILEE